MVSTLVNSIIMGNTDIIFCVVMVPVVVVQHFLRI